MAQFEVIKDVSVSLTKLLTDAFKEAGYKDIEIYNTLPTEENVKKLPAISLFMTAVSVDRRHKERDVVLVSETTEEGDVLEYERMPTMVCWLYYLLSSWGKTPQEEHVLLGLAMRVLHDYPILSADNFQGDSLIGGEELPIRVVDESEFGYDETMAFWRSLGEPVRPAVLYRVGANLRSSRALRHIKRVTSRNLTFKR